MSYMDLLPAAEPRTAEERIRSLVAKGAKFVEYEVKSNGDVLGALQPPLAGRDTYTVHWMDVVVPADGGKVRVLS